MIPSALTKIQEISININVTAKVQMRGSVWDKENHFWIHWFCFQNHFFNFLIFLIFLNHSFF